MAKKENQLKMKYQRPVSLLFAAAKLILSFHYIIHFVSAENIDLESSAINHRRLYFQAFCFGPLFLVHDRLMDQPGLFYYSMFIPARILNLSM